MISMDSRVSPVKQMSGFHGSGPRMTQERKCTPPLIAFWTFDFSLLTLLSQPPEKLLKKALSLVFENTTVHFRLMIEIL